MGCDICGKDSCAVNAIGKTVLADYVAKIPKTRKQRGADYENQADPLERFQQHFHDDRAPLGPMGMISPAPRYNQHRRALL